jgi:two-component system CheB/CheR fusion protein
MTSINQRLADLVDDLLNVNRIEEGRIEIKPVSLDLDAVITDVVKEMGQLAKEKNIELIYTNQKTAYVLADPEKTKQILINLVGNAIKYTEKGKVEIITEEKPDDVICHVKDTGLGISSEAQKKLFDKFYRVKTEKTRSITGTGLGLWITKKLVEMMDGSIGVKSSEGQGSDFYFSLPKK